MPEKTLNAFADHGQVRDPLPPDGGDSEQVLAAFNDAGFDTDALAARLQEEGKDTFDASWKDLLDTIASEGEKLVASK